MRIRVAPKGWVERVDQRARLSGISSPIWCSVAMISSPLDLLLKKRLPLRQPCRAREALRSREPVLCSGERRHMTKRLAQLKRRNLLTAPRDYFTCALGFFVHKYLINLTLRNGDQTTHDSHRTLEIQLFLALHSADCFMGHLITLNRSRVPLL